MITPLDIFSWETWALIGSIAFLTRWVFSFKKQELQYNAVQKWSSPLINRNFQQFRFSVKSACLSVLVCFRWGGGVGITDFLWRNTYNIGFHISKRSHGTMPLRCLRYWNRPSATERHSGACPPKSLLVARQTRIVPPPLRGLCPK